MKTLRLYPTKPFDTYGGAANLCGLKFFDASDNKLKVVVKTKARNQGTLTVNGINATITCPNIYSNGTYYYTPYIFNAVGSSYGNSIYMRDQNAKVADPINQNAGVLISFDEDIKITRLEISGATGVSGRSLELQAIVDENTASEKWSEVYPLAPQGTVSMKLPLSVIRCAIKEDGKYLFLKPKDKANG